MRKEIRKPCTGTWIWNDEKKELEFLRHSNVQVRKSLACRSSIFMGSKENLLSSDRPSDRQSFTYFRQQLGTTFSERTFTPRYMVLPRKGRHDKVTLEDVKRVALTLIEDQHCLCLTSEFSSVLGSKEVDEFLLAVINYVYCHLIKRSRGKKPESLLLVIIPPGKMAELSNLEKRSRAALRQLTDKYAAIILGAGLEDRHHLARGKSQISATWRDRRFFESLFSLCIKVSWVAFKRKKLEKIEDELRRIFKTEYFIPKLQSRNLLGVSALGGDRKTKLPSIHCCRKLHSPLIASILPTTEDTSQKTIVEYSFPWRFGIIGEPIKNFHFQDLTPLEPGEEEQSSI
ncbi:protein phosphatase 1 regulatory subunit 36-like isoform X2 [Dendrobates tinctorius]|uniref:protein phosphatase 1 regulatory subunit 36-like isoform X2 n=1 Tax=Dendrobates tinctorius TaxID=92724 RepID=UPI003CC94BCD